MKISEFQRLIKDLYYEKDIERGVGKTFFWFIEEVGELSEALRKNKNLGEEFADVFAWLVSLANLCGIELEEEVRKKYPDYCIKCGSRPCKCEEGL
ncbi:MazG nucleotide pyrophosphohydrolase domain-containing protein [Geoglobus acetivorans]|uniref:Nucleotide pyrophosphohydrolase n=1 Tax=Geoglobus acetivorans TaxID=565033 RepID=A0ABZ3H2H1_GEOAI|nr:nucleotide pyrophosphohydrolase [Geoglobus acetivorans]